MDGSLVGGYELGSLILNVWTQRTFVGVSEFLVLWSICLDGFLVGLLSWQVSYQMFESLDFVGCCILWYLLQLIGWVLVGLWFGRSHLKCLRGLHFWVLDPVDCLSRGGGSTKRCEWWWFEIISSTRENVNQPPWLWQGTSFLTKLRGESLTLCFVL